MEQKTITRKDFLTSTSKYAVGAVAGVAGLNMLAGGKLMAGSKTFDWPYPYTALDPEAVRIKAHTLYWNEKDCCAGTFGGITDLLAESMGEPWTSFPIEVMLFGRGGGVGWGSICGCLNGGAALISLVTEKGPSGALINELWGWYTTEMLPTDAANEATYEVQNYVGDLPQNISGSPLCHSSVSQWCNVAGKKVADIERKERCARITGDIAAKTVEILNDYFAGTFTGTFVDPETVAACMTCHGSAVLGNVMTHMECTSCHGDPHDTSGIENVGGITTNYKLEQNYPNPFNPTTNIKFSIPQQGKVRLEIYDIQGKLINSIIDSEYLNAGNYETKWNGTDNAGRKVSSGIYFARLTSQDYMKTIKMNLIK
ncbi:MAG: C-GCAxxG-C-C family protein [Melioribacteraceae bacterium]|nr:C-GCAxxG-C-C family protein [Melioribacteraceae bacterium]MCF8354064.1 C-GCAxxG-C-C family protein [Melioribacteraceae bacterium]MCF8393736.1 C-GCAxxG-C-C family protein [Melioribacteraceae bacterium]MCF8419480.1 C-GCAxxG-C-C family protein [Melioribacteraceae bacterium]